MADAQNVGKGILIVYFLLQEDAWRDHVVRGMQLEYGRQAGMPLQESGSGLPDKREYHKVVRKRLGLPP